MLCTILGTYGVCGDVTTFRCALANGKLPSASTQHTAPHRTAPHRTTNTRHSASCPTSSRLPEPSYQRDGATCSKRSSRNGARSEDRAMQEEASDAECGRRRLCCSLTQRPPALDVLFTPRKGTECTFDTSLKLCCGSLFPELIFNTHVVKLTRLVAGPQAGTTRMHWCAHRR